MAKRITLDTRKCIAHDIGYGRTFAEIIRKLHRTESTIATEVKNLMIWSNKAYGCTNAVCTSLEVCSHIYRTPSEETEKALRDVRELPPKAMHRPRIRPICLQQRHSTKFMPANSLWHFLPRSCLHSSAMRRSRRSLCASSTCFRKWQGWISLT